MGKHDRTRLHGGNFVIGHHGRVALGLDLRRFLFYGGVGELATYGAKIAQCLIEFK